MKVKCLLIGVVVLFIIGVFITMLVPSATAQEEIKNIVPNPDFDEGIGAWTVGCLNNGAVAQIKVVKGGVVGDCLLFKVDAVGVSDWEPEIHSPHFNIVAGKIYTVALWAKAEEKTRPFTVCIEGAPGGVGASFCKTSTMNDEWNEYWHTGTSTWTDAAWVHFTPNRVKGSIWLDHFRVYEGQYIPEKDIGQKPKIAVTPGGKLATTWASVKAQ